MIRDCTPEDADTIVSVWKAAPDVAQLFSASDFVDRETVEQRNTVWGKSYEPRSLRKIRETLLRATGEAVMRFGYSQITEAAAA